MQTGNSEIARYQCEGHATELHVSTCGFGGAEPSHRQTLAAAASRKGQGRRDTREDEHCAHELRDVQERCHLRGLKSVLEPTAVVCIPQAAAAELRHFLFGFQYFSVF